MLGKIIFAMCVAVAVSVPTERRLTEPSEHCPDDFSHWLLPHEWDCTKFYYCEWGEKFIEPTSCAPGTEFSFEQQVCVHPRDSGCHLPPDFQTTAAPAPTTDAPDPTTAAPDPTTAAPVPTTAAPVPTTAAPVPTTAVPVPTTAAQVPSTVAPTTGSPIEHVTLPNGCPVDGSIDQLLPHPYDCNRFFSCVHGELVEQRCIDGLHFNPVTQECDWPELAGCEPLLAPTTSAPAPTTAAPTSTTGAPAPTNPVPEPTTAAPAPSTVAPTTGSPIEHVTLPNGCPVDGSIHQLLPHPHDCNSFFSCVHGELVEQRCIDGLHFNPVTQACDWPELAGCEALPASTTATPEPTTAAPVPTTAVPVPTTAAPVPTTAAPVPTTVAPTTSNPIEHVTLPNGCPADWHVHQLLPHPRDCNRFFYCVHGELVERYCAAGLHFNPILQVCDWPADAGCEASPAPTTAAPVPTTAAPNATTTAPVPTTAEPAPTTDVPEPTSAEPAPTTDVPEPTSAEPAPTTDVPELTTAESIPSTVAPTTGSPIEHVTLPNGCPVDGSIDQLLPHPYDCNRFFSCVHGELVEQRCIEGLHFNPVTQNCDWPQYAGCDEKYSNTSTQAPTTSAASTTEASTTQAQTTQASTTQASTTLAPTSQAPTQAPVVDPNHERCAECNILPWAHETDCDKFWRCEGPHAVLTTCAEGLHFNPATALCDFMCNANCERDAVEYTAEASGLKLFLPWDKVDDQMLKVIEHLKQE